MTDAKGNPARHRMHTQHYGKVLDNFDAEKANGTDA
jgi:hypothetical protein